LNKAKTQDLVLVRGGSLLMGSTAFYIEESPTTSVEIDDVLIQSKLVTNAQFRDFVSDSGYVTTAERNDREGSVVFVGTEGPVALNDWRKWWAWIPGASWHHPEGPESDLKARMDHPVVHVSLHDARAYAAWAGLALPQEPEWEWCARGGIEGATYTWGEEPNQGEHCLPTPGRVTSRLTIMGPMDGRAPHRSEPFLPMATASSIWRETSGSGRKVPGRTLPVPIAVAQDLKPAAT